ncbi:hypothetical protein [Neobacillus vireti]|uniref:hypothetical protein n=1 Tax=Neobacillus vireti TaxID=220686 RepID=UPI002FFFD8E0
MNFDHHFFNKILKDSGVRFDKDELATILFRKKSELFFRDKLSYLIEQEILKGGKSNKFIVTPEWNPRMWDPLSGNSKVDIAILREKENTKIYPQHHFVPHTLIEIKNAFSPFILGYGATDNIWKYRNGGGLIKDIADMRELFSKQPSINNFHAILAINCLQKSRLDKYQYIVSDMGNFNTLNKMMEDYNEDNKAILEDVKQKLYDTAVTLNASNISFVTINGGIAYENEMDILYMILSF